MKKIADYLNKRSSKLRSSYYFWIGVCLFIGCFCEANLRHVSFLLKVERDLYDIRASFTTVRLDPKIIVVGIDSTFLDGINLPGKYHVNGHEWPLPRKDWAEFFRKAKQYKVKLVIFDVLFLGKKKGDKFFARQLKKSPPVILAQEIVGGAFTRQNKELHKPVRLLYQNAAGVGYVNARLDHTIRSLPLVTRLSKNGKFYSALSLTAARYCFGNPVLLVNPDRIVLGSSSWITNQKHRFYIRWANSHKGSLSSIVSQHGISDQNYLSLSDFFTSGFLSGRKKQLKNSILFVGAFDRTLDDIVKTPLGTRYGVVVHANILNDLLHNFYYVPVSEFWNLFLLLFFSSLLALFLKPFSAFQGVLMTGAFMAVYIIFNCTAFVLGYWFHLAGPLFSMVLVYFGGTTYQRLEAEKKKQEISRIYGKYLAPQVREELMKKDETKDSDLKGWVREVTVLESDIRGFTSLSEVLPAEEVVRLLNLYFTAMIPILYKHKGTWDKFIGDALLAYFGAPAYFSDHPFQALSCAVEMLQMIDVMREKGEIPFQVGIGIHSGSVKVGHVGADATAVSEEQKQFTIIGDTVNLAARLCGLAEGGSVYVSGDVYKKIQAQHPNKFPLKSLGPMMIKGKDEKVEVYAIPPLLIKGINSSG